MKKLVTLTASALLMASFATAASAAETTPTAPTTTPTVPADTTTAPASNVVTGTVSSSNSSGTFIGNNRDFSIPKPASWDAKVQMQEFTASQLNSNGQSGVYLVNFTYTPDAAGPDGTMNPVVFASIRGYEKSVWDTVANKDQLGTMLNSNGDIVYVLQTVKEAKFANAADLERFNALAQSLNTVTSSFTTDVPAAPSVAPINGTIPVTNDPSKISVNPTPTIDLTSMTPFYKSPGGTMIGYLGPQKLDTTGKGTTDPASGQWVEIYTWMGLAWIVVE